MHHREHNLLSLSSSAVSEASKKFADLRKKDLKIAAYEVALNAGSSNFLFLLLMFSISSAFFKNLNVPQYITKK